MSSHVDGANDSTLEAGAITLPGVLMQAITHIGPAVGLLFTVQAIAGVAGVAVPVALGIGGLAMGLVAVSVIQLSKKMSSAGGYFTWVSNIIGPRTGFVVAWAFLLFEPIGAGINLSFMGGIIQSTLKNAYGFDFPWWITALVGTALLTVISLFGLKLSIGFVVGMGIFEIAIGVALAVTGLIHPGNGGFNFEPFMPTHAASFNGLFLGVVFSIFTFAGFEAVAPLAEESANPTKTLPRAVILSLATTIVFFLIVGWGTLAGWGTNDVTSFVADGSPVLTFARGAWGPLWILVLISFINSIIGVGIAVQNASSRVIFGMARARVLPPALAVVHARRRTPTNAVLLQSFVTLVVSVGGGFLLGTTGVFAFAGIIITILIIVVYISGNVAVWRLYRSKYRDEYSILTHLMVPIASSLLLLYVGYKTLFPLPTGVNAWAPIVAIVWLVVGGVIVAVLSTSGSLGTLRRAGTAMSGTESNSTIDDGDAPLDDARAAT
ncbi:APC family permease [Amycolatopsis sp. GM8]|uniref:APC family permease n=1 Tax=Amycolatopsis sp. GM8 TaxID=2896530 RepID=UPI001F1C46AD|nr:APC family permease [Amycolatopsis sp. GM8]